MTPSPTLSAQEQIEYIATKIMGWRREDNAWFDATTNDFQGLVESDYREDFRPLTDWNHWRQVEEKLMEDAMLFARFIQQAWCNKPKNIPDTKETIHPKSMRAIGCIMNTDLPTRCQALIAAHQSLNSK